MEHCTSEYSRETQICMWGFSETCQPLDREELFMHMKVCATVEVGL